LPAARTGGYDGRPHESAFPPLVRAPAGSPHPVTLSARVAVGIPSYQEADSIAHVVTQTDVGLARLVGPTRATIVNVDGDSSDGTPGVFLAVPTECRKESLVVADQPGGKGRNLLRFFRYCAENDLDALAVIDADITSVTPDWIEALLGPVLGGAADFVAPLYQRSRFEGATTIHFAYPLFYAAAGRDVRQPIGGDFGLSRDLVRHLNAQPRDEEVYGYGIDIFMSLHAARAGFRLVEASLGKKLHKPSFAKRGRIFREVLGAALTVTRQHGLNPGAEERPVTCCTTDDSRGAAHVAQGAALFLEARAQAAALIPVYRAWLGAGHAGLAVEVEAAKPGLSAETWTDVLAAAVAAQLGSPAGESAAELSDQLYPLYSLRSVTFWNDFGEQPASVVDAAIVDQARLFRRKLLARMGLTGTLGAS
jgi:mannosylglycerate synthase-like protein